LKRKAGKKGKYVARETTVADVKAILEGKYDEIHEDKFLFIGEAGEAGK